ncbi:PAAR-like domain-containing protein [Candidatus Thiosymbion oneisti]|uniref:PAAR-like domain-containing protein n=1 Tax=Candidatus Thiosymbion oneisti TaxID=589554 RepID=UPI001C40852D|nr:PAAR-like domain-containing protein [Candidatus Thiosymbion oneisti]
MADQEGARKSGEFIAVSLTPDVCLTPAGATLVPVPYMIVADLIPGNPKTHLIFMTATKNRCLNGP